MPKWESEARARLEAIKDAARRSSIARLILDVEDETARAFLAHAYKDLLSMFDAIDKARSTISRLRDKEADLLRELSEVRKAATS